jgi:hypothetical protein
MNPFNEIVVMGKASEETKGMKTQFTDPSGAPFSRSF